MDKSPGGFHKSRIGGKCGRIMCIKKSTLKIPQIKGFFENDVNKPSEKVDRFPVNPQVIHKLSTKCGKLVENFGDERVRKLRCVLSSKKYPESLDVEGFIDYN